MKEMYHRKESRLTPAKPADGDDKRRVIGSKDPLSALVH